MELFHQIYKIHKLDKYLFLGKGHFGATGRKKPGTFRFRANIKTTETEKCSGL